ncbi:MAG: PfkB family carbohydrate kinase [Candidatus Omnitrophota bacterium]
MERYTQLISKFKGKRILVIGDIILDQYIRGTVSRISPEAPVPVVLQEGRSAFMVGGAANVASNLSSLGAEAILAGRIGSDAEGKILLRELKKNKVSARGVFVDRRIPTSMKTRIIAQHQQVVRIDREKIKDQDEGLLSQKILKFLKDQIPKCDAIIISDYGKGIITPLLVTQACTLAIQKKKIFTVDPKVEHFRYYNGVTAITPNKKETENAIQNIKMTHHAGRRLAVSALKLEKDQDIDSAGSALVKYLNLDSLLITLGELGMRLFEKGKKPVHINTKAREVFDVSGAGDTVISVFTLSLTAGATKKEAADLSNYAAGIVVAKTGAVPVAKKELLAAIKS